MFMQELARIETEFYRGVNSFVEPLVRAGVGSPVFWPVGAIVLEITGRNTGQSFNVPLLAARVGDLFVVSTYRRRSEWVKNLAANSEVRYWLGGRQHDATAFVLTPDRAVIVYGRSAAARGVSRRRLKTAEPIIRKQLCDTHRRAIEEGDYEHECAARAHPAAT